MPNQSQWAQSDRPACSVGFTLADLENTLKMRIDACHFSLNFMQDRQHGLFIAR